MRGPYLTFSFGSLLAASAHKRSVEAREILVRFQAGAPSAYDGNGIHACLRSKILQVRLLLGVPSPNIPTEEEAVSNTVKYRFESYFGYQAE